jgi:hypothetical protein
MLRVAPFHWLTTFIQAVAGVLGVQELLTSGSGSPGWLNQYTPKYPPDVAAKEFKAL